jgi:phosphoenolpyruvate synthase/pyruvate phosphate dikinase
MPKKTKSFRLDEKTIKQLLKITEFTNQTKDDILNREITQTDIITLLIQKEYNVLRDKGYKF